MSRAPEYDAIVVGGGFFGCSLALHLRRSYDAKVTVLEMGSDLMQRASYVNQARVHNGYHYPRSILTGLRSRINFPRFVSEFNPCIVDDFNAYYAVARRFSKVSASQFRLFCERIGAPIDPAPKTVRELFDPDLIEAVFRVQEYAFDADELKVLALGELQESEVEIRFGAEATLVESREPSGLRLHYSRQGTIDTVSAARVFNCTYSRTNKLLVASGLPAVPLKHELTEMALVEVPEPLRKAAVTVMCGPFFSIMPFPARGLHSLSHVRYTPHGEWHDEESAQYRDSYAFLNSAPKRSNYLRMRKDAERYLPCLSECRYEDSIWEVKTVLPLSERDDSRPILFVADHGVPGLDCVMGGKIDNIFDMIEYETRMRRQRDV
jgi:glycine/D-amino acid oxidase-like deaminating enzyme